ncbi:DUF3995 domain-containing protein [Streptosporangium pseudovulgare]|uniref:DUF3995 domain-containing protein n=1 Tax=Streptosporangium pseudovulgare TaxID=35765 RepID=A0ABQ2QGQ3_9ACTN|nr:DUF3995 domain-containing protein [Streptosporangium pseudovulgare]GGP79220.1 hypothetical protein GCM10010140_04590 [Streptosporangium pseudovulgare]
MRISLPAAFVAAGLLADAFLHLYWLVRPAADPRALSLAVLDFETPFTARTLVPLIAVLTVAALSVIAVSRGQGGRPAKVVTLALGGGLLVRAELGLAWASGLGTDTGTPFYWLNLLLYTPLCVALGFATGVVLIRATPPGRDGRPGRSGGAGNG